MGKFIIILIQNVLPIFSIYFLENKLQLLTKQLGLPPLRIRHQDIFGTLARTLLYGGPIAEHCRSTV